MNNVLKRLAGYTDLLAAGLVVLVVVMMIVPLPPLLLDFFITINISVALATVVTTLYVPRALDFSAFPSLLLLTTLFRLAINISVTRLILLEGDAGHVVEAFGNFVVGGNVVVGIIVFIVLVIIQFMVVTNGAGRVAEVSDLRVPQVRVLGRDGGTAADIAAAITWASGGSVSGTSKNKTPAKVINLSLGGRHGCESFMQKAIDGARKRGAVVVVSAGNSNESALKFSPASCKNVITVAATDRAGERASYSNYGSAVELAAPGGDYGATVASTWNTGVTTPGSATWGTMAGTSQAAPAVSAAAGLLASLGLSRSQIEKGIVKAVSTFPKYSSTPSWSCRNKCGAGYLDLQKVLAPKSRVTISGTAKVGSTLTAKVSYTGKITSRTYTWYRSGTVISGVTGSTYKLKSADRGKTIKVKVTPKGSGSYLGITSTSASTSKVS